MAVSFCKIGRCVASWHGRVIASSSRPQIVHGNARWRVARNTSTSFHFVQSRTSSSTTSQSATSSQSETKPASQLATSGKSETKPASQSATSGQSETKPASQSDVKEKAETNPVLTLPAGEEDVVQERFIPISRRSLVRLLMQEPGFLSGKDQEQFEELAVSLDWAIINQYHGVLAELKQLFDPVNPDQDTLAMRFWRRKDMADSEFWLLRKLAVVMGKANFHELPKDVVEKALAEHVSGEGVSVSVNPKKYEVLRFWALGKEQPKEREAIYKRLAKALFYKAAKRPRPAPIEYYKRVVLAVRPKGNNKLILKMFKEIPTGALEQLLPDGKIQMTRWDQGILATAISIGSLSLLVKGVTFLADVNLDWTLITASVTGLMALSAWNKYKNRRTRYMMHLSRTLYFKNVANNRGVLTLLVDRAQEETFKEALLTYAFLLAEKPSLLSTAPATGDGTSASLGGVPASLLERKIESWVQHQSKASIGFDSSAGTRLLESLGILQRDNDDRLSVVNVETALRGLPRQPVSIVARETEQELDEGYDQEMFEREEDYKREDKRNSKWGWK